MTKKKKKREKNIKEKKEEKKCMNGYMWGEGARVDLSMNVIYV
jgi:hypothetical protein